jgi:membrane protease YdiL (CAAX protease family)
VGWALLLTFAALVIQVAGQLLLYGVSIRLSLGNAFVMATISIPSLLCGFLVLLLAMRMNRSSWMESFRFLGFKEIHLGQAGVAALSLIPIILGNLLGYFEYYREGASLDPYPDWQIFCVSILIITGLFEEVFFRGFLFRMLRPRRSFFAAAAISSALWALCHAVQILGKIDPDSLLAVGVTMVFAFVLGIALSYLFERAGNVLWGCMLVHFVYDALSLVDVNHKGLLFCPKGLPAVYFFGGIGCSLAMMAVLSRKLKP